MAKLGLERRRDVLEARRPTAGQGRLVPADAGVTGAAAAGREARP